MPVTRQRARKLLSPSNATTTASTPTTNVSPIFSHNTSLQPETPLTSDVDEEDKLSTAPVKRATRSSLAKDTKKRPAESENDQPDKDEDTRSQATKRRIVTKSAYVEIPVKKGMKGKQAPETLNKGQKKGKAPVRGKAKVNIIAEIVSGGSEDELGLDEDASIQESGDSGSEFELSEEDYVAEPDQQDSNEEFLAKPPRPSPLVHWDEDNMNVEDAMMTAAMQMSLQTYYAGAGSSSSGAHPSTSSVAATQLCLARTFAGHATDDADFAAHFTEPEASSSDEEPLSVKGKGKAKAKTTKKPVSVYDTTSKRAMTWADLRKQRRLTAAERRAAKKEEAALMMELGRRLTHAEKSTVALQKYHPELKDVWGDLAESIPVIVPQKAKQPADLKVTLLPFQLESLFWMRKQEKGIWRGGMLADEMGMGKTIQIISLFISDGKKPNLVIAPTVAIMQWRNEIEAHTEGLKVLVWHGSSRESDVKELKKFDVVLTTYAILESCFRKQQSGFKRQGKIVKEKSPLHQMKWNRVVLDEAHNIKERATNTAKAAFELDSNFRWCLSGTPLQNRVGELYSLVRFLGGDPFSYYFCKRCDCKSLHWRFSDKRSCDDCGHSPMQHTCFWNNEILTPIQKNGMVGPGKNAFKKLKILLDRMMLRRTKIQRADDLGLPPRTVVVRRDYFSPEEKELYLSLFSDAKRQFNTYVDSGTVLNNYSNIFSLLTRMRQMACHPDLVIRSKKNAQQFLGDQAGEATVCRLCHDIAEDAIQSKCRHIFDRECIKQYLDADIESTPDCPVCHLPLTIDLEAPALELEENVSTARQGILGRLNLDTWRSSSKIEALVEELSSLRTQDATTKSLVFSQFVSFLDLIAFRLQKAGFNICRLEGTMSPQARDATIQHFMNNVDVTVFLVSLKAGGVALNLTEASRVYLMDSWWNPAVEYQAMDRIHRLGQHRPVQATKLVVEDSIESRIVQLQEKKSAMVDATLSADDSAMGRLTPEDLGFLFRL